MKTPHEFVLAKTLSIRARFVAIAVLAACGIFLQLSGLVLLGWLPVLLAAFLGMVRGRSNKPAKIGRQGEWRAVTIDEFEDARRLIHETAKLDAVQGPFRLGSLIGCGTFIAVGAAVWIAACIMGFATQDCSILFGTNGAYSQARIGLVFVLDAGALLLPLWLAGRVNAWQPPNLSLRLGQMLAVYRRAREDSRLVFEPSFQIAPCEGGSVPTDCRLMVKIRDCPPAFTGIQVQTAINVVQGNSYPYTYCVLIAKPEFELLKKAKAVIDAAPKHRASPGWFADSNTKKEAGLPRYLGAVVELQRQDEVEIVVVRQATGGGGYTTSPDAAYDVFSCAYALARSVIEA